MLTVILGDPPGKSQGGLVVNDHLRRQRLDLS